jgi:hypothetical protein
MEERAMDRAMREARTLIARDIGGEAGMGGYSTEAMFEGALAVALHALASESPKVETMGERWGFAFEGEALDGMPWRIILWVN